MLMKSYRASIPKIARGSLVISAAVSGGLRHTSAAARAVVLEQVMQVSSRIKYRYPTHKAPVSY